MKNKGFTLIELMIVLVLMGIVYSIYFFTIQKSKNPFEFNIHNMKKYMKNLSLTHGEYLKLIYYFDQKVIYIVNKKNDIVETIKYDKALTEYVLKENEELQVKDNIPVDLDGYYFEPTFIYEKMKNDIYSDLILNTDKNEWYVFNTFIGKDYNQFISQSELIKFIKKQDYLYAFNGKPE